MDEVGRARVEGAVYGPDLLEDARICGRCPGNDPICTCLRKDLSCIRQRIDWCVPSDKLTEIDVIYSFSDS